MEGVEYNIELLPCLPVPSNYHGLQNEHEFYQEKTYCMLKLNYCILFNGFCLHEYALCQNQ